MTPHEEKARALFKEGYNCAQAILVAFSDVTGLDVDFSAKIASSFGGGMARLREVCGAVSGMFMVAGYLYGYTEAGDREGKIEHYALIRSLAEKFSERNGAIVCRELLKLQGPSDPVPEERTEGYYHRRPCENYIGTAAAILDELIAERGIGKE